MPDGHSYQDLIAKHGFIPSNHAEPRFFPVSCLPVFDAAGREIPGYQHIYREDTGSTLAMHTADYKLVPYETNFARFEQAIESSGLDTTDMMVATDMTNGGGRVFRQYLFPKHTNEILPGDSVALRIIMFDSYDGTYRFRGLAGHYRFVCANTAVIGKSALEFSVKHTKGFDERVGPMIEAIVSAAASYQAEIETMRRWTQVPLNHEQARELVVALPQSTETLADRLFSEYVLNNRRGVVWDLYNVLTNWATHTGSGANAAQGRAQREDRVLALTRSKTWKEIVDA